MKPNFRVLSLVAAAAVILRGLYLVWRHLSPAGLPGHYAALGAFMDYLVYFGALAAVGVGLGVAGRSRAGIIGNLSHLVFAILYAID